MTTAALSPLEAANSLKHERLLSLVIDIGDGKVEPDDILTRAREAGVEIDRVNEVVQTYQTRKRALRGLERVEEIKRVRTQLEADRKEHVDKVNALCASNRRLEEEKRLPVYEIARKIESDRQESRQLHYDSTKALRETEDPMIEQRLEGLAREAMPVNSREDRFEDDLERIEAEIADAKTAIKLLPKGWETDPRYVEQKEKAEKKISHFSQQRRQLKSQHKTDQTELARIGKERDQLVALKSDPMAFAM